MRGSRLASFWRVVRVAVLLMGRAGTVVAIALAAVLALGLAAPNVQRTDALQPVASIDPDAPPNFVVLVTDDQSRHEFNREVMPNLCRHVVDEGAIFDQFTVKRAGLWAIESNVAHRALPTEPWRSVL